MSWLKQLFSRRRLYNDLSEEIRAHLDEKIDELVASGMPQNEATAAARREFGNVTLTEQDSRAVWRWPSLEDFLIDIRYALRNLRQDRRFTLVAILALALGTGSSTAIFSVVDAALLRPLPYREPSRLVWADEFMPHFKMWSVPSPEFANWSVNKSCLRRPVRLCWGSPVQSHRRRRGRTH
jgi:putative ABC transport system permease protein